MVSGYSAYIKYRENKLSKICTTKSYVCPLNLAYAGHKLIELNNIKFCGLQLDSQHTWKTHVNYLLNNWVFLTVTGLCIANIFSEYNRQGAAFLNLFISVRCSKCFRQFFRLSSGTPDDGWKNRLKHVERLTEINKLRNASSCWFYSENKLSVICFINRRHVHTLDI